MNTAELLDFISENESLVAKVAGTIALLILALLVRAASLRFVRKLEWRNEAMRLLWLQRSRHVTIGILFVGTIAIWATQLRSIALSAIAVAVALVVATKEIFLCLSGAFVRTATESFQVGDRIEVGDARGDVISYGPLGTTLLEVGPAHRRTGRTIVIPNSRFVTDKVINESSEQEYVLHVFTVPMLQSDDWRRGEEIVLRAAEEACAEFVEPTREQLARWADREGGLTTPTNPQVRIQIPEAGKVQLLVRIPVPARDKGHVEDQILRAFLSHSALAQQSAAQPE